MAEPASGCPQCAAVPVGPVTGFCPECGFPLSLLADKYRLLARLGQGGFGTVYLARHVGLQRDAERVVKVLPPEAVSDGEAWDRFQREVELTASLSRHDAHVVRVYDDFGRAPGLGAFYVMEYLQGESLRQRLQAHGRLPLDAALDLFEQLCEAMAAAHRAGVVHRDLKPDNVLLLQRDGRDFVKVIDFGIAKDVQQDATRSGLVIGTPAYMSPEQCRGEAVDARSDVYALGVILYELLLGRPPFPSTPGPTPAHAILMAHLTEEPEGPAALRPSLGLPVGLDPIVLRALAKRPDQRYATADAFWRDLAPLRRPTASGSVRTELEVAPTLDTPLPRSSVGHNLVRPATRFIGRERELAEIARTFAGGARLVTLVGTGGLGKTRLALEYAVRSLDGTRGRAAWLVDASEARSVQALLQAVAGTLGIPLAGSAGEAEQVAKLGHALADRGQVLLVLDNFEQLPAGAAQPLHSWLQSAHQLELLVTSRTRLRLAEEVRIELEPLAGDAAVALLSDRAIAAGSSVNVGDSAHLAELARQLDGNALAIELAAARLRVLTPQQLLERLGRRFELLRNRHGTERHDALRAAIDWSWDLLTAEERTALAQCAVFRGGFTLQAAEAVVDAPAVDLLLEGLLDHSLLRALRQNNAEPRFGLFESIRAYGEEKLSDAAAVQARHAAFYVAQAEARTPDRAAPSRAALEWLTREQDNLLAAHASSLGRDPTLAARASLALEPLYLTRGPIEAYLGLLEADLAGGGPADELAASLLAARGDCLRMSGRTDEAVHAVEAAVLSGAAPGRVRLARGQVYWAQGRLAEAEAELRAALALMGDVASGARSQALEELARTVTALGRHGEGIDFLNTALGLRRHLADGRGEGHALELLAGIHLQGGRLREAIPLYRQALALSREADDRQAEATALGNCAMAHLSLGEWDEAAPLLRESLALLRRVGTRREQGAVMANLGWLSQELGRFDEAESLYRSAIALHEEVRNRTGAGIAYTNLAVLLLEKREAPRARESAERALEILTAVGHRAAVASTMAVLGLVRLSMGEPVEAVDHIRQAIAVSDELGVVHRSGLERAWLSAALAQAGRVEEARVRLAEARERLETAEERDVLPTLEVIAGHVDLAEYRAGAGREWRGRAEQRLAESRAPQGGTRARWSSAMRLAIAELERDLASTTGLR